MPVEFWIDEEKGVVRSRAWGVICDDDFISHQRSIREDPAFHPRLNQIFDMREIESVEALTPEGMRKLADGNPFGPGSRRLMLTASKVVFGLARMFQTLTDQGEDQVRVVFDDAYLAERWLTQREGDDSAGQG